MLRIARDAWWWPVLGLALPLLAGCGQNAFLTPQQQMAIQQQQSTYVTQVQELERRVNELDISNRDMYSRLAQSDQQQQVYRDQVALLQQQLKDTANQLRETQLARQEAEKNVQVMNASSRKLGGATITANNSVRQALSTIEIPGVEVRQDQEVIRIEMPADELFQTGTGQVTATAYTYLDRVADAVARNYPRQRIVIEGHTDSGPTFVGTNTTMHQLSSAQAMAVFDTLTRRNRLPPRQFSVMGMGANYPRASNATDAGRAKNRRVELVIYPQAID
jgi:flagellar motor protein MotB